MKVQGPLIGGALSTAGWRWVFWFTVPISITCIVQLWWLLPQNELSGNFLEKLRKVDFVGSLLSLAAVVLILVSLCFITGAHLYSTLLLLGSDLRGWNVLLLALRPCDCNALRGICTCRCLLIG
jgi:predicted MFS family arabinose efflux permease